MATTHVSLTWKLALLQVLSVLLQMAGHEIGGKRIFVGAAVARVAEVRHA